jgi:hypothetical protein
VSLTVCLAGNTLGCPTSGGYLWIFVNWALGLRALGCRVIWFERIGPNMTTEEADRNLTALKNQLVPYDLSDCLTLDPAVEADLLLDLRYDLSPEIVGHFRRSALVDIDPGLLQIWLSRGEVQTAPHDVYFTIGETVGQPQSLFPDAGKKWLYTPPCISLDHWPVMSAAPNAPFTTVSNWYMDEWMTDHLGLYCNDKRWGFLPFLDLPQQTTQPLELALCAWDDDNGEADDLRRRGWRLRDAAEVASAPGNYQRYVQSSRGEFSCAKPGYQRLQTAWISDRTLCYLASGKPAVVQHTGTSRFLPDAAGLFRFRSADEAARHLEAVAGDYDHQCRLARQLAEEHFDARKVVGSVLERALA